jgi:hypothetical protein
VGRVAKREAAEGCAVELDQGFDLDQAEQGCDGG